MKAEPSRSVLAVYFLSIVLNTFESENKTHLKNTYEFIEIYGHGLSTKILFNAWQDDKTINNGERHARFGWNAPGAYFLFQKGMLPRRFYAKKGIVVDSVYIGDNVANCPSSVDNFSNRRLQYLKHCAFNTAPAI